MKSMDNKDFSMIKEGRRAKNNGLVLWSEVNLNVKNQSIKSGYIDSIQVKLKKLNFDQCRIEIRRITRKKVNFFKTESFQFQYIIHYKNINLIDSNQQLEFTFLDNYGQPIYFDEEDRIATVFTGDRISFK
jgi:hypothetical protein